MLPRRVLAVAAAIALVLGACGEADPTAPAPAPTAAPDGDGTADDGTPGTDVDATGDDGTSSELVRCVVRLHGKGGDGSPTRVADDGVVEVQPTGNAEGWGGRQWLYVPAERYAEALGTVRAAVDAEGCDAVVVNGFSNGGAFAAALLCSGETLDGRLTGVVVDDPVTDRAVEDCAPSPAVGAAVYWTGGLADSSAPGTACAPMDWTCAGDELLGIEAYAAELGVPVRDSIHDEHRWWWDAPAVRNLLTG